MEDSFRTLIAIILVVAFICFAGYYLIWPALLIFFLFGPGGFLFLVIILIAFGYFLFVGVSNGMGGGTTREQKREVMMYQRRRGNMPPPEPHTTDHYDFQMLSSSYHMLQWLADAPYAHICYNIEQLLRQKMADSRLLDIAATSMPQWQTVEIREEENGQTTAASRTGMAFEFVLHVSGNGQTHQLTGVYTWAGSRLNRPPAEQRQRIWLDLNGTLAEFGGSRMAERLKAAN